MTSAPALTRVVILGHTGYIGRHLENYLQSEAPGLDIVGYSFPDFDLTNVTATDRLSDVFTPNTAVIMCSGIKRQLGDNLATFEQNIKMAINIGCLLQRRPVGHFTFFSSCAVYGEDVENTNITEESTIHPRSYYGIAKFSSETILRNAMGRSDNHSLLIVRPPLVYGPGDAGTFYGPSLFAHAAVDGNPVPLWGDGLEKREFLYIDDIVNLVSKLTLKRHDGILNLVSGQSHTFAEILGILAQLLERPVDVQSRPRSKNKADHVFNPAALQKATGSFAFTPLEQGLKSMLQQSNAHQIV